VSTHVQRAQTDTEFLKINFQIAQCQNDVFASRSREMAQPFSPKEKDGDSVYVASQAHLLKPTTENPLPTAVPPPNAALAGLLGVRHVLVIVGLPERGKCFIAQRLSAYLYFFHGAEVKLFDVAE